MKITKHFLKKLETLYHESGYKVRYEKGQFNSGYCVVEDRNMIVINKFYDTEARGQTLMNLFDVLDLPVEGLTEQSATLHAKLVAFLAKQEAAEDVEASEEVTE